MQRERGCSGSRGEEVRRGEEVEVEVGRGEEVGRALPAKPTLFSATSESVRVTAYC